MSDLFGGSLPERPPELSEAAAKLLAGLSEPHLVAMWITPAHEAAALELQRRGKARLRWTAEGWRELRPVPAPAP